MRRLALSHPDAVLAACNSIVFLVLWKLMTADPGPQPSALPALAASTPVNPGPTAFKAVLRETDREAARLFGSPAAEPAIRARLVDTPQPREPALRLVGVILVEEATGNRVALVEHGEPPQIVRLRSGAVLNPSGWRVEHISQSSVELIRENERRVLKLD